jgi:hypothetical protein
MNTFTCPVNVTSSVEDMRLNNVCINISSVKFLSYNIKDTVSIYNGEYWWNIKIDEAKKPSFLLSYFGININ